MSCLTLRPPVLLCVLMLLATFSYAQDSAKFILDLPVIEAPYSINNSFLAYRQVSLGMQGSQSLTKSVTEPKVYYIKRLVNPEKGKTGSARTGRWLAFGVLQLASDLALMYFPLGEAWNHEEWHRAVLTQNNVRSYNDVNNIPLGQELIAVSHLTDEDLAAFKKRSSPGYARLPAAGIEGQIEMSKALQKDNFFNHMNLPLGLTYFLTSVNTITYVQACSKKEGDDLTTDSEKKEGTSIEKRDFAGLDMTAWIYDLSRPDEPYEARGVHPSGVGIRRYRLTTDLTEEELNYLRKMGRLQFANFISPAMFFFNSIRINKDVRFNVSGFHYLTSFGYDIGGNLFLEYKNRKIFAALHNYHNLHNSFVGLEMQGIDFPFQIKGSPFLISPAIHLWTQPAGQGFRTSESSFGGRIELNISTKAGKYFRPYAVVAAKTKGWVAGDSYLDEKVFARFGVKAYIH